jgi:hypothetical protein
MFLYFFSDGDLELVLEEEASGWASAFLNDHRPDIAVVGA